MIVRAQEALTSLASALAERIGPQRYGIWFKNATRFDFIGDYLQISVANPLIGSWIEKHFGSDILEVVKQVVGVEMKLSIQVDATLGAELSKKQPDRQMSYVATNPEREARVARERNGNGSFYTVRLPGRLENFIVGPSNRMAHSAVVLVIDQPSGVYNPLFIHGGCGLGKTHLLQAACNAFAERYPDRTWRYVTGEDFTNDYIYAMRHREWGTFRNRYRQVDLLVIDDVHFIANKPSTQQEFLHTFNTVFTMGKQVILSSDAHPRMIGNLSEQLTSRLISGMVVRIDVPDLQVRLGVLTAHAQRLGVELPDAVKFCIAENFRTNIRELEGALLKVTAMARLTGQPLTLSLAQRALDELVRHSVPAIHVSDIETATSLFFGLTPGDLHTSRKTRTIALARSIAMYLARKHTCMSYPEIGRFMGNKNHSTVILAYRRVSRALQRDETVSWPTPVGQKRMNLAVLIQDLEDQLGHRKPPPDRGDGGMLVSS